MRVITKKNNILFTSLSKKFTSSETQPKGRPITSKLDPFGLSVLTRNAMLRLIPTYRNYRDVSVARSEKGACGRRGRRLLPSGLEKNKSSLETSYCNGALGACQDIVWFNIYLRWTSDELGTSWKFETGYTRGVFATNNYNKLQSSIYLHDFQR